MRLAARARARAMLAVAAGSIAFAALAQDIGPGRELFVRGDKGNCVACHQVPSDPAVASRATVGPALANVRDRLPGRAALREMLVDPTRRNPDTLMPPYGRHRILGDDEIGQLIDYLHAIR
jgi:sulfur-oxidizing protein SoxX